MNEKQALLRQLPSVDQLLQEPVIADLVTLYGRSLAIEAIRAILDQTRTAIKENGRLPSNESIHQQIETWLADLVAPTLQPVINGTGVIVHTNLGRAPLSEDALQAIQAIGQGYSTLEFDIESGQRGSRTSHPNLPLQQLLGCEASLVVNNNAAAVLLMLTALCQGKEVIISRGQLVEIGGGFRIPDVMAQSGAKLVEVGTTNRTHLYDYERAINENTGAILVAHHSNYKIVGFTSEPSLDELATLAHQHNLPLLYDQGSGGLLDTTPFGIPSEPTVTDGLQQGCDIVAFSGDKLLGGPQAGIICGRQDLLQIIKKHPLARAVRADKFCLAGLTATLTHYIKSEAFEQIPVWQMISRSPEAIQKQANTWQATLAQQGIAATVITGESTVGGGSVPGTSMPTFLLSIQTKQPQQMAQRLRSAPFPVITRIQDDQLIIDPRTILIYQVENLLQSIVHCYL